MCFSAEASFATSAVITACGVAAIRKAEGPAQKVFGSIPLIFGMQQFAEGLLWISLSESEYSGWENIATGTFLVFAWIIWPLYVPLSTRLLEKRHNRKLWLNLLLIMGIGVSVLMAYKLLFHNVDAVIAGYHIQYKMDYQFRYPIITGMCYFLPIALSLFISSVKKIWVVGAMVIGTFSITAIFYREHLISVWCFFAAITSIMVLWMVYRMAARTNKH